MNTEADRTLSPSPLNSTVLNYECQTISIYWNKWTMYFCFPLLRSI